MSRSLELDFHTHTVMSGHAYSSLQEMAYAASCKGLKLLGITDHAPVMEGAPSQIYFEAMHLVPRRIYGIDIMMGAELNILDEDGTVDLPDKVLSKLDFASASLHANCYKRTTIDQDTQAVINAMKNPYIQIICHPGDGTCDLHFEQLVLASMQYRTLLEINNSSLRPDRNKPKARENNLQILRLCKKYGCPVILGSDAHISFDVADFEHVRPLLAETEFPDGLIVNYSTKRMVNVLFDIR